MSPPSKLDLADLGWQPFFEQNMTSHEKAGMIPARVVRQDKGLYTVMAEAGRFPAEVSGRLRHRAVFQAQLPVVGDWTAVRHVPGEDLAVIHAVLARRSYFSRKQAGGRTDEQVLCANVDTAFIVSSLVGERGFVLRRIERYLTLAWEASVEPVIVLNKRDLCEDVSLYVARAKSIAFDVPVLAVSALTGEGMDSITAHLGQEKTAVLLGPSGAGKSSLINALLGDEVLKTGKVRTADGRGRHITTWREMVLLPGRGVIIDTPGLRELQLWADGDAVDGTFAEIMILADRCRFRDCTHEDEPGCAVREAVEKGALAPERLDSYLRQQAEVRYLESRKDQRAKQIEQAKWKSIHKSLKTFNKIHPKGKWMKEP